MIQAISINQSKSCVGKVIIIRTTVMVETQLIKLKNAIKCTASGLPGRTNVLNPPTANQRLLVVTVLCLIRSILGVQVPPLMDQVKWVHHKCS